MVVLTSFPPPTEGIRHKQPNTTVHVESKDLGKGTLYVAESRVSWVSEDGQGFSLEYPAIALHAVSRDLSAYPHQCLYLMIDKKIEDSDPSADEIDSDEEDEKIHMTEIRFIPDDNSSLESIFSSMSECQVLHPDPDESFSEDEDEENFEDAEEDSNILNHVSVEIGGGDANPVSFAPSSESNDMLITSETNEEEPMDVSQFEDAEIEGEPEH